jgi:hypothetical protein
MLFKMSVLIDIWLIRKDCVKLHIFFKADKNSYLILKQITCLQNKSFYMLSFCIVKE